MTEPRRGGGRRVATAAISGLSKDQRFAELEGRLAKLEGTPSLRARSRSLMDKVMPAEASEHFRNAGREHLMGVRSIVDFWIARIDESDSRAAGRSRERETIEIE